ncbi:MAG: hypothetical protein ACRDZO_06000 [Egibacteraceae bacterium]
MATGADLSRPAAGRVAATFTTITHALTRHVPEATLVGGLPEQDGLQGGQIRVGEDGVRVLLDEARRVAGLAVTRAGPSRAGQSRDRWRLGDRGR